MMRFKSKIALVTGGSSGIGAATCRTLTEEGASVAINHFEGEERAKELAEDLRAQGGTVITVQADVSNRQAVKRMVEETHKKLGKIDLLVNNAGDLLGRSLLIDEAGDLWRNTLSVNLDSVLWVSQAVLPDMIERKWGRIVNNSSAAARHAGEGGIGAYVVAKAGVVALTKVMAKEYGQYNINVNCVLPGWIETPLHARAGSGDLQQYADALPLKRIGTSEEVASVIAFLLSDDAGYMTGAMLDINAGMLMP